MDYGDVKALFKPVYNRLDHHRLDEITGLADSDPASVTQWIRGEVAGALPQLDRIDLYETPGSGVSLCWGELGPALPA
ncbi:MAG: 6-carboxytetrahydropterin synthase [Chromatiaceae bacterium]